MTDLALAVEDLDRIVGKLRAVDSILELCKRKRRPGERLIEVAKRELLEEAMRLTKQQKAAGDLVGMSTHEMTHWVKQNPHVRKLLPKVKTHCVRGHPRSGNNLNKLGACLICIHLRDRERRREYRERKSEQQRAT